jgi:hypothetical protein
MKIVIGSSFLSALLVLSLAWLEICNGSTQYQRLNMIHAIPNYDPDWKEQFARFDKVSHEQHMWARFFFRDPCSLYSKEWETRCRQFPTL